MRISPAHIDHYLEHGFVVVESLLADMVDGALGDIAQYFPTWDEFACAHPSRYPHIDRSGVGALRPGPFRGTTLNAISVHPELAAFAECVIGTSDLVNAQSLLQAKYAGTGSFDQSFHVDYGNHSLAYPRDDATFRQVACIVYFTDVTHEMGPTAVCSQQLSAAELLVPTQRSRDERPGWYERETTVTCPAGSVLLYSMRTFHRGTAMSAASGARFTQFVEFHCAAHRWMGYIGWPHHGGTPEMARLLTQSDVRQRSLFGFPPPGHAFWNAETLAGVGARFPEMDMSPYAEAMP